MATIFIVPVAYSSVDIVLKNGNSWNYTIRKKQRIEWTNVL